MVCKFLLATSAWVMVFGVSAQEAPVPKHLQLARDFVAHTRPEHNTYTNKHGYTKVPGELFSSNYVVYTDCSGFVESMLDRSQSGVVAQVRTQHAKSRKRVVDWYPSIEKSEAFIRLYKVSELVPGDVVAWLHTGRGGYVSGHMLFIDSVPAKITPRQPQVDSLDQYEVTIIDTSQAVKSLDDTRYVNDPLEREENLSHGLELGTAASANKKGVGRGTMRFYAEADGGMKGLAFNLPKAGFHADGTDWHIVMGRPRVMQAAPH
jgi:hypothetical protein